MKKPFDSDYLKFVFHQPEGWRLWVLFVVTKSEVLVYNEAFNDISNMGDTMSDAVADYIDPSERFSSWRTVWTNDSEHVQKLMEKCALSMIEETLDELPM